MLSRKQVWRKTSRPRRTDHLLSFLFSEDRWKLEHSSSCASTVSSSINDVNSLQYPDLESGSFSDGSMATDQQSVQSSSSTPRKRVTFSNLVKVCLIPTRQEMIHLAGDLYWTCAECEVFKREAFQDIQAYSTFMDCSCKEAILLLFQPGSHKLRGKEVPSLDVSVDDAQPSQMRRSCSTASDLSSKADSIQLSAAALVI